MATSTFTQLLSSVAHCECCFMCTETARLIRDGEFIRDLLGAYVLLCVQDGHLDFHTAPEHCVTKVQVHCCFASMATIRIIRDGGPGTATSTFTQLLSIVTKVQVHCCFASMATIRIIRYWKPRTTTSTFTRPLNSWVVVLSGGCVYDPAVSVGHCRVVTHFRRTVRS